MKTTPDASHIYDYVIVGSGPAGSVMAWRLASAGARVLMLEAGEDPDAADYPDNELDANARLFWNGGMGPSRDARLALLRARVVGGGSVVNQCLLDRFDSLALDDWQARTGLPQVSLAAMAPFYTAVESQLNLHYFTPDEWNGNARLYVEGFERCGFKWAPLRRGQSNCAGEDCIVCLGGCPRESKQSMPVTFLRRARQAGLQLLSGVEARQLIRGAHFTTLWSRRRQTGELLQIRARKVILAAGALGSSGLLLRSGLDAQLPALGQGFYCHPQYMTLARFREPVDAHKGALQAVKSDDPRFRQQGFKLENVFAGPVAIALLKPGYGLQHQRFMRDYRHLACMEVAIRDQTPGRIRLDRNGRIQVEKPLAAPERQRARAGLDTIRHIFSKLDATEIIEAPQAIGLHLMGGCSLGQSACNSVVGADFHLHGMADVMVIDGAVFPSAPGINPSLSIMALAWQAADSLLGQATVPVIESAVGKTSVAEGWV